MKPTGPGDLFLARLLSRAAYRWTLYCVFFLTATASLYLRVGEGRTEQVLPWYGSLLSIYGFGMAAASEDSRCRISYLSFGVLIVAAFSRALIAPYTRWVGAIEVLCCLTLLWALSSLSRDGSFMKRTTMLESPAPASRSENEKARESDGGLP